MRFIFFPPDFPKDARDFSFVQAGNGNRFPGYKMPLERNHWYKIEFRVKMGKTPKTGKFQLWVDNVQRSDLSMTTAHPESDDPGSRGYNYKFGMYAYKWRAAPKEGPDKYRYLVDHLALASTRAEAEAPKEGP